MNIATLFKTILLQIDSIQFNLFWQGDTTEILLKVELNTINHPTNPILTGVSKIIRRDKFTPKTLYLVVLTYT
jgi:hypothetical protein